MKKEEIKVLLDDRILVRPDTEDNKTKAGIIISAKIDSEKEGYGTIMKMSAKAEVILEQAYGKKMKVGDHVLYGKMAGFEIKYQGKDCKMLRSTDLSAVIKED